jgi:hypothetical protein
MFYVCCLHIEHLPTRTASRCGSGHRRIILP